MAKKTEHKKQMESVVKHLKTAISKMEFEKSMAKMGKDWPTVEYLASNIEQLKQIVDGDGGDDGGGLESFVSKIGDI